MARYREFSEAAVDTIDMIDTAKTEVFLRNLMVTPQEAREIYREGMASLASAVHVVTTMIGGRRIGFAATAVCSVTDDPPTLLVCLNRNASVYDAFSNSDRLCVNTLAADQQDVSKLFGGKTPQAERFFAGNWGTLSTGAPVLEGAAVAFDCRVKSRIPVGTHDVMLCQVECVRRDAKRAVLVYFSREYREID
jgi:flavin reductase